jgi:hypothetical protein
MAATSTCHRSLTPRMVANRPTDSRIRLARPKAMGLATARISSSALMLPCKVCSRRTRSAVISRCCSTAALRLSAINVVGHGLVRKRKMEPLLMAATAWSRSPVPVNRIRTVSGAISQAWPSSLTPSIPDIRRSETITAKVSPFRSRSRASAPQTAVEIRKGHLRRLRPGLQGGPVRHPRIGCADEHFPRNWSWFCGRFRDSPPGADFGLHTHSPQVCLIIGRQFAKRRAGCGRIEFVRQ